MPWNDNWSRCKGCPDSAPDIEINIGRVKTGALTENVNVLLDMTGLSVFPMQSYEGKDAFLQVDPLHGGINIVDRPYTPERIH